MTQPKPKALINAIQHSGHLGIAAIKAVVMTERPMLLDPDLTDIRNRP
jgi:hypothetical protein